MCLVALAIDQSRRFPLVLAANRDEFFARPTARLAWWTPDAGGPAILSGRDLQAGGTWLGLTAEGRLGLVTNVRHAKPADPQSPSRGQIVAEWLASRESADRFWMRTALSGYNGFNLIAADFRRGDCFFATNQQATPQRIERGVYGLSNASLDTPWPKVNALKARLADALPRAESVDALSALLFEALADRTEAAAHELPETGLARDRERMLSAAFIRAAELNYGTRSSTLVIAERVNRHLVTHVLERSFSPTGVALLRRSSLKHWPPRYTEDAPGAAVSEQQPVSEAELELPGTAAAQPVKRTRVRSLLKPPGKRVRASAAAR